MNNEKSKIKNRSRSASRVHSRTDPIHSIYSRHTKINGHTIDDTAIAAITKYKQKNH